jgi:heme exporter protein B
LTHGSLSLSKEIPVLLRKEIILEWRQKYAINGLLLYVGSTVFVCYLSFSLKKVPDITWNTLLWIILLFTSINAIAKSFMQERYERYISKMFYNILVMCLLTLLSFGFYSFVMRNPVQDIPLYMASLLLGATGFANNLTMVAAIASKVNHNATLMAVMSFPIILPMLIILLRLSKNAMDGLERSASYDELMVLCGMNLMIAALSYILFPYLWKS